VASVIAAQAVSAAPGPSAWRGSARLAAATSWRPARRSDLSDRTRDLPRVKHAVAREGPWSHSRADSRAKCGMRIVEPNKLGVTNRFAVRHACIRKGARESRESRCPHARRASRRCGGVRPWECQSLDSADWEVLARTYARSGIRARATDLRTAYVSAGAEEQPMHEPDRVPGQLRLAPTPARRRERLAGVEFSSIRRSAAATNDGQR
jgi:hypothetical protein